MAIGTRRKGLDVEYLIILIPSTLAIRVEVRPALYDRFHQKTIFGSRGQLITDLLLQWLAGPMSELPQVLKPVRRAGSKQRWTVAIPKHVHDRLDELGILGSFGASSRLLTFLLENWVLEQEAKSLEAARKELQA